MTFGQGGLPRATWGLFPEVMNEGLTCPKGPGLSWVHPTNNPAQGDFLLLQYSVYAAVHIQLNTFLLFRCGFSVSASSYVANVMYFKSQLKRLTSDRTRKTEYGQIGALY